MLLAVDIGNTNISFGLFSDTKRGGFAKNYGERGRNLIKRFDIPTKKYTIQSLRKSLSKFTIDDSIICSVVPKVSRILKADLKTLLNKIPRCLGKDIKVPINNLYRKPKQVGQDRLANAYAGIRLYGVPLIVVDFGTAVTFDAISRNKEYLGGLILPGLELSLDALTERAALLPKIKLNKPKEFIGRDTRNSMLSGIIYGFAALTDDLAERIKAKIGKKAKVIGTGGSIHLIGRYCKRIDKIDKDLTLKGLALCYNQKILLTNKKITV